MADSTRYTIRDYLIVIAGASSFFVAVSWVLPHGCAQSEQAEKAINLMGECDEVVQLVGENLRPTIGYAMGSYESLAGETRSAFDITVRGDAERGVLRYRYHSRHGLEAVLTSQGESISLADCAGSPSVDGGQEKMEVRKTSSTQIGNITIEGLTIDEVTVVAPFVSRFNFTECEGSGTVKVRVQLGPGGDVQAMATALSGEPDARCVRDAVEKLKVPDVDDDIDFEFRTELEP